MPKSDDMLPDVEMADPTFEAMLTALTVAEGMATLFRAETKVLEGETRQVLQFNHALTETVLSPLEPGHAATGSARR